MRSLAFLLALTLLALASPHALAQTPRQTPATDRPAAGLPIRFDINRALVTAITISDDGGRVAVACYIPPMNRARTDWSAFVATWDLETGERTLIPNATAPIVMSGDGELLLMPRYERAAPRHRHPPTPRLAVWRFGEAEPTHLLDDEDTPPATAIVRLPRDRALAAYADGSLRLWRTSAPADDDPALLDERPADANLARTGSMIFSRTRDGSRVPELITLLPRLAPYGRGPAVAAGGHDAPPHLGRVTILDGEIRDVQASNFDPAAIEQALTSDREQLEFGRLHRYAGPLHAEVVTRLWPFMRMQPTATSAAPQFPASVDKQFSTAVVSLRGRVWVIDGHGRLTDVLPFGGGVVAASGNAEVIAVVDADRTIRVWDTRASRLVRTLSLHPDADVAADTFRVAAVQAASVFGDAEHNREQLVRHAGRAAESGARIIVLPEAAVTGYLDMADRRTWQVDGRPTGDGLRGVDPADVAETVPGPSTRVFAQLAQRYGVYVTVPLVEIDHRTGRYYNTVVLLGPDGQTLIRQRKLDPWAWAEQSWATAGDLGYPVADTPFGRVGILICHDIHQHAPAMAEREVDLLLHPLAWVDEPDSDWFDQRLPEIAREHGFAIIAANWESPTTTAPDARAPDWHGHGHSRVIASDGKIVAQHGGENGRLPPASWGYILADLPLPAAIRREPRTDGR